MKIIGIESSSNVASIAVLDNDKLLCEYTMNNTMKHSKTLMPMLDDLLKRLGISIREIELLAVSEGPGSFTGLRIGSATAKGLAHGLNVPIVNVPTLEVLAVGIGVPNLGVGVLVHSRANELYYAQYCTMMNQGNIELQCIKEISEMDIERLIEQINHDKEDLYLVGDGVDVFRKELEALEPRHTVLKEIYVSRSAKQVALLGYTKYQKGEYMSYHEQKPYYYKKAQAERELEERLK